MKSQQSDDIPKYDATEITEVFSALRSFLSLRVQVYSFFGTVSLAILGAAATTHQAALIALAAAGPATAWLVDRSIHKIQSMYLARGTELAGLYASQSDALVNRVDKYYSETSHLKRFSAIWLVIITFLAASIFLHFAMGWPWLAGNS